MIELVALTTAKKRNQTVGRDQDFGTLEFPAAAYRMSDDALTRAEPLTQEDLDRASYIGTDGSLSGQQVIENQKTQLGVFLYRIRLAKDEIKKIRDEIKAKRKAEWARLLAKYHGTLEKVFWEKRVVTVHLPARYALKRSYADDSFEVKTVTGFLPRRLKGGGFSTTDLVWTTRKIRRRIKAFKKVLVQPAKTYQRNARVKTIVHVTDWGSIHWEYAKFVNTLHQNNDARLNTLYARITDTKAMIKKTVTNHYCMRTYTTDFCVGFKSTQAWTKDNKITTIKHSAPSRRYLYQLLDLIEDQGVGGLSYDDEFCARVGAVLAYTTTDSDGEGKQLVPVGTLLTAKSLGELRSMCTSDLYSRKSISFKDDEQESQPAATVCTVSPPTLLDMDDVTSASVETAERLAASNVQALKGARDYVFNLVRSIGELKDIPESLRQGKDFLLFCKQLIRGRVSVSDDLLKAYLDQINDRRIYGSTRVRSAYSNPDVVRLLRQQLKEEGRITTKYLLKMSLKQLVAFHLAWKFAIAPTIDDVDTVCHQTVKWLMQARRLCSEMIETQRKSTVLHMRSRWRQSKEREHKLFRVEKAAKAVTKNADGSVVITLPPPSIKAWRHEEGELPEPYFRPSCQIEALNFDPSPISLTTKRVGGKVAVIATQGESKATVKTAAKTAQVYVPSVGSTLVGPGSDFAKGQRVESLTSEELSKALLGSFTCDSYAIEEARGVVFANYSIDDVLEFLDSSSQGLLGRLKDYLDKTNFLVTAWELTPLSFIEDWFVNSGALARGLQNLASVSLVETPDAEIWATRKFELLTGCPTPRLESESFQGEFLDWYEIRLSGVSATGASFERFVAVPKTVKISATRTIKFGRNVVFGPSGLRRAYRGAWAGDHNQWFDLRARVSVNNGKLVTLAEMLIGMLL